MLEQCLAKKKIRAMFYTTHERNTKWIRHLHTENETMQVLQETGHIPLQPWCGERLSNYDSKARSNKRKD